MSSFDFNIFFYFIFYSIYVFHENVCYKAKFYKIQYYFKMPGTLSRRPRHAHTFTTYKTKRNRYILNIVFLLGQRPTMQSLV